MLWRFARGLTVDRECILAGIQCHAVHLLVDLSGKAKMSLLYFNQLTLEFQVM